ncbi:MAG TPA: hypothetical protein VD816_04785 [Ohtaekwangia sp.]|nr:hypothetical protein [Ohtaekwangia sp.]
MKLKYSTTIFLIVAFFGGFAQHEITASLKETLETPDRPTKNAQEVVLVTGVRFAYPLVQKWIDDYARVNENVQIVVESRGVQDPAKYDILIEAYEPQEAQKKNREYVYVARYAILPVANSQSAFGKTYSDKGLDKDLIRQVYFHDMYADKENERKIKSPYTIYTRLQRAGSPIVFTGYFGFEQKDLKGKTIAGSDEHLLKAVLRDSTAVSYLPLSVIYDRATKRPVNGLVVLPVDLNDNGRVSDDEKFYDNLTRAVEKLGQQRSKDLNNVPLEYLHFSVDRNVNPAAVEFIRWVVDNKLGDLSDFGFLQPEPEKLNKEKFEQFASQRTP